MRGGAKSQTRILSSSKIYSSFIQDLELYIQINIHVFHLISPWRFPAEASSQHASWSPNLPTSPQSTTVGPGDQAKSSFLIICPQVLSILSAKLYNSPFFPAVAIAPKPRPLHLSWAAFFLKLQASCLQSYYYNHHPQNCTSWLSKAWTRTIYKPLEQCFPKWETFWVTQSSGIIV